ncbi:(Dimethylallyl)adenosine tRNA methylthiotransferase miaB [Gemmatirosa kalamazoonensis]|uniref:tRNA-2-methylthio-N(6)-dimethylallyladenosine synthase n=1 Tax=Gemmatirosa kalamazoonensis TaxID=861299 RepID=W0RMG9_9BACT|nr:tRNA (N6-isopentenyl adenosine(37)-C2)-methylthiotransferase MiaB [Gemmatirosa kalamazoonensis]AHG90638.1 (Dimethylallyl)adenosine tRNA methylthiotransferase miaB [Gemmatirosa kalamazoonensis]
MSRPTVYIETYGCQMNVSDSELMYGRLAANGYEPVEGPEGADVILVNTCAIRDHAEQRVIGRLGELRRFMKPGAVLGVAGCMAQRLGPTLLEKARHVSLVVGPDGYRALPALLDGARSGERVTATSFDLEEHYEDFAPRRFDKVKAWIPVQRGCDYRCTYCIVPYTRGAERSRRLDDVVRETEQVVRDGMTEVVLLGQTVNSYHDGAHDFADLLRAVGDVAGIRRIRFTSPHPNDFTDRVIDAIASVPQVCEHVHLPMQSGSSRVLKRMLRRYTREGYAECVRRLRDAIPGVNLTTDIIVGFPGETEADFEETLSLVQEIGFEDAYTFKFSPRDGTPATRMPASETVSDAVASERLERLIATVRAGARERNLRLLGTRHEVLVEREAKRGEMLMARTRDFKTVMIPVEGATVGAYYTVELTGTSGSTFTGAIVRDEPARRLSLPMAASC